MPTITFKVDPDEAARIRRLAQRERTTVSEYLRRRALDRKRGERAGAAGYRIVVSRKTGLPVLRAPSGAPRVTSEQVRALLADFP